MKSLISEEVGSSTDSPRKISLQRHNWGKNSRIETIEPSETVHQNKLEFEESEKSKLKDQSKKMLLWSDSESETDEDCRADDLQKLRPKTHQKSSLSRKNIPEVRDSLTTALRDVEEMEKWTNSVLGYSKP